MGEIVQNIKTLRQKSEPVASVEEATGLIQDIEKVLAQTPNGVGLAAIQIGVPKRIAVAKYGKKDEIHTHYLINPEVVEADGEVIFHNEGCLSFPGLYRNTKRYQHFVIKNQVIDNGEFREEKQYFFYSNDPTEPGNTGLIAIAVQHEIDHMNGDLLIDKEEIIGTPIKAEKKIGRNDPCPCGSGKKYKKCCA